MLFDIDSKEALSSGSLHNNICSLHTSSHVNDGNGQRRCPCTRSAKYLVRVVIFLKRETLPSWRHVRHMFLTRLLPSFYFPRKFTLYAPLKSQILTLIHLSDGIMESKMPVYFVRLCLWCHSCITALSYLLLSTMYWRLLHSCEQCFTFEYLFIPSTTFIFMSYKKKYWHQTIPQIKVHASSVPLTITANTSLHLANISQPSFWYLTPCGRILGI